MLIENDNLPQIKFSLMLRLRFPLASGRLLF